MPSTVSRTSGQPASNGYTLIELSIVMMVVGLLLASFLSAYNIYKKNQIRMKTDLHASMVASSLGNFLIQEGRYPCPARVNALRTDADYGMETECDSTSANYPLASAPGAVVAGTFANGLWFEQSTRSVDINPGTGQTLVNPIVRRGGVPFRTLGIPEDRTEDGYGSRFSYAATEILAVTATYQRGNGAVLVHNSQGQTYFKAGTGGTETLAPEANLIQTNMTNGASQISESLAVDSSRAYGTLTNSSATLRVSLADPVSIPASTSTVTVRWRAAKLNSSNNLSSTDRAVDATVTILVNGVGIATCPLKTLTGAYTTYTDCTFSASLVTDWSGLQLDFSYTVGAGTLNRKGTITWAAVEAVGDPNGYAHYFLSSAGKDQAGAYSRWGQQIMPCQAGTLDAENCNTSASATYRVADYTEAAGALHFDDFVKFYTSVETPLWRISGTSGGDIRDLLSVETTGGKVGISTIPDMSNTAVLQVGGEVRATVATMASELCDPSELNCFSPGNLGDGVSTDFQCSAANGGAYAVGFEGGKIKCSDTQRVGCLPGQFVTGVLPTGVLECTTVVGCDPMNISLCDGTAHTIPSGVQGQNYSTPSAGYNFVENWQCGPNPFWQQSSTAGVCNCAPVDENYDLPCTSVRTGNWTGITTFHHVHTCPADTDSVTEISNTCVCVNDVETVTDCTACGAGFSGCITQERTWNCSSGTAGAWTSWVVPPGGNTCTCNPQPPLTQDIACSTFYNSTAYTGTISQQNDFQCPAGTWSGWYETGNTCSCNDGQVDTQTTACSSPLTGTRSRTRTFSCGTNSWSTWSSWDTSGCVCTPDTQSVTLSCTASYGAAYTGSIVQHRDFTCPAATWGTWVTDSDTCTCTGSSQTQTIGCTAPLAGSKTQQRDYQCNGPGTADDGWSSWYDIADNCYLVTYSWVPKTPAEGPYASQLTYRAGNLCTNAGEKQPCSATAGGGLGYWHYSECQCE